MTLGKLAMGLAGVLVGAELIVDGALDFARAAGIDETIIGLTLVALGTSLPEVAASVIAARRKHSDVALGNAIGSCIFNILAIMGIVSIVKPIAVPQVIMAFDLWVMLGVTVGFVVLALALPRIGKLVGLMFLLLYGAYVYAQFAGYSQMMQSLHTP
jgi:cation:H+ antiporter